MKYIQLKYQGIGRRTKGVNIHAHGFMGPSKSPMGKGPLEVAGEYLRKGTLTTAFQLIIPPSNECQLVDCQHNRERLRVVTKPRKQWEDVKNFDEETGKYIPGRKQITHPPSYVVLDGTPIDQDIVLEPTVGETTEITKLKAQIAKLTAEKNGEDGPPAGPAPEATTDGETKLPEEDEPEVLSAAEITAQRFKNKVADPVSLV